MTSTFDQIKEELEQGNFTRLRELLGGPKGFDQAIIGAHQRGDFANEIDTLNEAFACGCMLGQVETVKYLLAENIDPYAGMKTWLAGPHWAVSGGHAEIVNLLLDAGVPTEVKNKYGGTLLGQALWSIVQEPKPDHPQIIQMLINAGAEIEQGTLEWWSEQELRSEETKHQVAEILKKRPKN